MQGGNDNNGRSAQNRAATVTREAGRIETRNTHLNSRPLTDKQCTTCSPPCEPPSSPVPEAATKRNARNGRKGSWTNVAKIEHHRFQGNMGPVPGTTGCTNCRSIETARSHKQNSAPLLHD